METIWSTLVHFSTTIVDINHKNKIQWSTPPPVRTLDSIAISPFMIIIHGGQMHNSTLLPSKRLLLDPRKQGNWLFDSVLVSGRRQFFDKLVNFLHGDIGHDYDVSNVLFASQLPSLDEIIVHGAFQDDCRTQIIETARDACCGELVSQILCRVHAVSATESWNC